MEMPAVTAVDLAYIAGLIDGEGCISVNEYAIRLTIANTHQPTLAWVQSLLGGNLRAMSMKKNWRPSYLLVFHTRDAVAVLESVLPFLRIKKEEAQVAILFDAELRSSGRAAGYWRLTKDDRARRDHLIEQLRELRNRCH